MTPWHTRGFDPRVKPERGTCELDLAGPLALRLVASFAFDEGGGTITRNLVTGRGNFAAAFRPRQWGCDAGGVFVLSDKDATDNVSDVVQVTPDRSVLCCYRPVNQGGGGNAGNHPATFGSGASTGTVEGLFQRNATSIEFTIFGSDLNYPLGYDVYAANRALVVGASRSVGGGRSLYLYGCKVASDTTTTTYTGSPFVRVGELSAAYTYAHFWSRAVTSGEFAWLAAEPYAMFQPLIRRTYSIASSPFFFARFVRGAA